MPLHPPVVSEETEDRVGLAFRAMAVAILLGVAVVSLALLAVRTMLLSAPAGDTPIAATAPFAVLLAGTAAGVGTAAAVTWALLKPVRSQYRRGGLSAVSGFATIAGMLVAMPAYQILGRAGLVGLTVACAAAAALLGRRLGREGTPA